MKALCLTILIALTSGGVYWLAARTEPQKEELNLRALSKYEKITEQPFLMEDMTAQLCKQPSLIAENIHAPTFPAVAYCNVYVNELAKQTILSGEGMYAEGSLIIKSKLKNIDDEKPELYTVMRKMPKGYDAARGDWQYMVVSDTFRLLAAGKIDSCIGCHDDYKETDYVTRLYLNDSQHHNSPQ